MRKLMFVAAAPFAATALAATPAAAQDVTYVDCGGGACFPGDDVVNIDSASVGTVDGVDVFFSSTETLTFNATGQASLGALDGLINNLTFAVADGFGFSLAEFNLLDQAIGATLSITTIDGISQTLNIDGQGANRFGIDATEFGLLSSATLNSTAGFGTFTQLRLDVEQVEAAVPEPATWAMLLLGFGAVGFSMRRRRQAQLTFRQAA